MAGRTRTTKKLAQRINLDYFKTLHGIPRWRRILSAVFTLAGLAWLGWYAAKGSAKPYSAGPLVHAHAFLGQKCGACHISKESFQRQATDQACLACHDGPIHHSGELFTPTCSGCHVEHQGLRLAATADSGCTQCHGSLKTKDGPAKFAADITSFNGNHPEFAALRSGQADPGTIKFNHHAHLKKYLRGPQGTEQLKCADCHRPPGVDEPEATIAPAAVTLGKRSYMEPVDYQKHCSGCHVLDFDRRFSEPVPHKEPKVVYDFVAAKLGGYIAAHPQEITLVDEPDVRLPRRPPQPPARNGAEWVQQRLADAQLLLWHKTCEQCHTLAYPNGPRGLPVVAKAVITRRWLPHANFDHQAHQMVACASCHAKARLSQETADVLIPGIETCRQCHHSGADAAEARCFECHTYHDWSKEKPAAGGFSVSQLTK